jgi:hypothetical protein
MDVVDWLDYRHKLTEQREAKYKVLYPTSATYLCGCVVEKKAISIKIKGQELELRDFIADHITYYFDTNSKLEAQFIVTILNSPIVDSLIKPMQARGIFGPRHIHKKVWELPIPEFDQSDEDHKTLVILSEACTKKVLKFLSQGIPKKSIGNLRKMIKAELKEEIKEIDGVVRKILKV